MYDVTVVNGAGKGKFMWSGPETRVMIALGRKKSMQYVLLEAAGGGSTVCHHSRRRAELLLARQPGTDHPGLSLQPMTGRLATRPSNTAVKIQMASCNDSVAGPFGNADTEVPWRER